MLAARQKLGLLLAKNGSNWRNDKKNFPPGDGPQGSVDFSPVWFQQGHDVCTSLHKIYSSAAHSELGNGARPAANFSEFTFMHLCIGMAQCHVRI